ncbi:hypothetical protein DFH09DRAFT_1252122 [Mycena vulgaris]|nr:hypothetical protein DFH09DRAFT_1252122 [Mycena vulgaris]
MEPAAPGDLLNAFRAHYNRFQASVTAIVQTPTDSIVIGRLGDDLDEFVQLVRQNSGIFDAAELATIQTNFLRWAYSQRPTAGIHRFLGVSRGVVRSALLRYGIATPQSNPFPVSELPVSPPDTDDTLNGEDDLLDPRMPIPDDLPADVEDLAREEPSITSYTGSLSELSNEELDILLLRLRSHFRRAGLAMLDGMLRRLGHRVPRERVRQSLLRIDPVRRIFERIRIRRRIYSVAGPNALWHHDGQHGKSVHNVRIERLWVDVTAQLGATWSERFTILELRHGLDINNVAHIWLLHFLFLATINSQLAFFAQSWNQHRIQIRHGPNRSPADMFVFDMLVNGVRGNQLPAEKNLSEEELEVYGIDWAGLRDDTLLASQRENNPMSEGATSWIGRVGPPPLSNLSSDDDCIILWTNALAYSRLIRPDIF